MNFQPYGSPPNSSALRASPSLCSGHLTGVYLAHFVALVRLNSSLYSELQIHPTGTGNAVGAIYIASIYSEKEITQ